MPAGLEYTVSFLAGRPVISAFPPRSASAPDRGRPADVVADARPSVAVAPQPYSELSVPTVLSVPGAEADGTQPRPVAEQDIALIKGPEVELMCSRPVMASDSIGVV